MVLPGDRAVWVTSVDIMPDGSYLVWLRDDDIPWVTLKELSYDSGRKQFIYTPND